MSVDTGKQFKKVAEELFEGNLSALARAMDMKPGSFSKYTSDEPTMPGSSILIRLISLDINLNWFLAGIPPMRISDMESAQTTRITYESNSGHSQANYAKEKSKDRTDYFSEIDQENLTDAEARLLAEVKQFSDFLKNRPLNPYVKRLLFEQLIESIDQAKQQPPHDQDDN